MAILRKEDIPQRRPMIDLNGPEGNAFILLAYGKKWAKELGLEWKPIMKDAMSGDYEHLLSVMDAHFGDYVDFVR